ncbi:putative duf647 domain protein [Golovinomyces cichoracearum]|uniref:Putative duf647 domain protein n=1 Tax=Golovinomyces cichoracearum TaxID=62708 RepID=A0A420J191_9PEZI|nr:putative duf647 domain protein [Golovinomyces cichoracearum]
MAQERLLNKNFIISEVDLAGNHVADYITTNHSGKSHRIDLVVSKEKKTYNYLKNVIEIFLPVGYPNSVTADYLPYQIFVRYDHLFQRSRLFLSPNHFRIPCKPSLVL